MGGAGVVAISVGAVAVVVSAGIADATGCGLDDEPPEQALTATQKARTAKRRQRRAPADRTARIESSLEFKGDLDERPRRDARRSQRAGLRAGDMV
jgi:hypothetical protein